MVIGFIGAGSMGSAIASGLMQQGFCPSSDIVFTDKSSSKEHVLSSLGVKRLGSVAQLAQASEIIILAVKPQILPLVLPQLAPVLHTQLVVSIAAGVTLDSLAKGLSSAPTRPALVRVMPNVNAQVGKSMSALCANDTVSADQLSYVQSMFWAIGQTIIIPEVSFPAFSALAACAPAWAFAFVEALARAGVEAGLTKAQATLCATQMMAGSAAMLQANAPQYSANDLIDMVCSPGGTTIAGLLAGEAHGFSPAVTQMVRTAITRDKAIGKEQA